MDELFCICCLQHRESKHFSIWMENPTTSRRCNLCSTKGNQKIRMNVAKEERKAKATQVTQTLTGKSKDNDSKRKVEVRSRIEDIKAQKLMDDEIGL